MSSFTPFYQKQTQMLDFQLYPWFFFNWGMPLHREEFQTQSPEMGKSANTFEPILVHNLADRKESIETKRNDSQQSSEDVYNEDIPKSQGRVQSQGRNDYSNILKAFVHLLKTNPFIKQEIKLLISKKDLKVSYERFHAKIRRKFGKGKTYISPKETSNFIKACDHSKDESEQNIGQIFKIILFRFLQTEYTLSLMKSFKAKKQTRMDIIQKTRSLKELIFPADQKTSTV